MEVKNSVYPNEAQIKGFFEPGAEGPIFMVNLLKFKARAEYEDGRVSDLTGEQAYGLYGDAVSMLLKEFGGGAIFSGTVERLMLGEVEELWDKVAIAMYPSRQAMLEMMQSPKMQEIGAHRAAGLAGQLNIETVDVAGLLGADSSVA
ncbi:MAG: DUF1330 domain-containing protein [SAR86 cluster bacterium]|uniref:DUF1330 domain-containing protein n=1 Tax=SAR86 cluster bacterium TaxID=2030880 RepID=A0A972VXK3_9GAMM|nr:DUF1330 domain-containing protein [SAR86 cluster bacterium]